MAEVCNILFFINVSPLITRGIRDKGVSVLVICKVIEKKKFEVMYFTKTRSPYNSIKHVLFYHCFCLYIMAYLFIFVSRFRVLVAVECVNAFWKDTTIRTESRDFVRIFWLSTELKKYSRS